MPNRLAPYSKTWKKTGIEAVVVTINSIGDYQTGDATIEAFATNLFNTWGIGHKKENNGVLILVAVKDRKARIELGKGYGREYDSAMKWHLLIGILIIACIAASISCMRSGKKG